MNSLVILFYLLLCCCNGNETNSNSVYNKVEQTNVVMNEWKKDKNGCLKIRNKKLAETLLQKYNLRNRTQSEFLKVFGVANEKKASDNQQILVYYFDSVCNENELVKGGDKCYAQFYFEKDSLKKEIFLCE